MNIYYENVLVGTITGKKLHEVFTYSDVWKNKQLFPISLSIPFDKEIDNEIVNNYFSNFLPEGELFKLLCKSNHISQSDIYGFLGIYGKECAGALCITNDTIENENITYLDITNNIPIFLRNGMRLYPSSGAKLSLAGAQDKIACCIHDGRILIPAGYAPTTHIIKPANLLYKDITINEFFCTELAKRIGLPVNDCSLVKIAPEIYLYAVKRFDRIQKRNSITRLHQEDMCQALGLNSVEKYQNSGAYDGYSSLIEAASRYDIHASSDTVTVAEYFAQAALYDFFIGNFDHHLKNYSIIYGDSCLRFSPLYDIVSSEVYPELERSFAMSYGDTFFKDKITALSFQRMASEIGIEVEQMFSIGETMIKDIITHKNIIYTEYAEQFQHTDFVKRIDAVLESSFKMFANIFNDRHSNKAAFSTSLRGRLA